MMINSISIIIGYILGSVSPAYYLGKILKNVDIRQVGEKNAGTTNVYKVLGLIPAIICGIYDVLKGLLAMWVAYLLGANELFIYLSGMFAIIGHIFPFYLGFRGGQGAATCTGLLIFFLIKLTGQHSITYESLGILALLVLAILVITRQKGYLSLVVMPYLFILIFKNSPIDYLTIFTGAILLYLFSLNVYLAKEKKLFVLQPETLEAILPWRTVMRPLAVVFPIACFYFDKKYILLVIGILGGIFLLLDLIRLASARVNIFFFDKIKKIFKKREKNRFSSITLFFLSIFITILLFPKFIAITAICFLIFGDVFAKFFGLEFGKTKIGEKSLEGSIAHLIACLLVSYLLLNYVGLSPVTLICGSIAATLAELLPVGVNDNFSVALAGATVMYLVNGIV